MSNRINLAVTLLVFFLSFIWAMIIANGVDENTESIKNITKIIEDGSNRKH
jgi:uncharacterized membrane protein